MALRSKKKKDRPEDDEPEVQPDENADDDAASEETPDDEDDLTRATRERGEYLDAWQRARADYQNLRRRLQTDIDSAIGRAKESMLLELLLVLDFMDMALAAPVETQEAQNLKYGVEMTRNQMLALLEREDVRIVPAEGDFDPALHDAIEVVPHDELEAGDIVETARKGYTIGDRTLRPAQVKVAGDPAGSQSDEVDEPAEQGTSATDDESND